MDIPAKRYRRESSPFMAFCQGEAPSRLTVALKDTFPGSRTKPGRNKKATSLNCDTSYPGLWYPGQSLHKKTSQIP